MSKIYFFGDLHFSSTNKWNILAGNKFLDWFKEEFKDEKSNNYIIFLGDVTDRSVNPGEVISQMHKLFTFCSEKFKQVYVLTGNHDLKMYVDFSIQSSLEFLKNFNNIKVIEDIELLNIEGKSILALPFKRSEVLTNINEYYSEYKWEETDYKKENIDLAIGHWTIKDESSIIYRFGVDVSNIPAKRILCGHIHNRPDKRYVGSVFALNASEFDCKYPRCYIEWGDDWKEIKLPDFVIYRNIKFGNTIEPESDKSVYLYTVSEAPSIAEAYRQYPNIFIKGISKEKKKNTTLVDTANKAIQKSNAELFDEMIKESDLSVSRGAYKVVKELLALK